MKKLVVLFAFSLLYLPLQTLAHHPAADIVDEDIYAMIDEMVAETPHADIVFDDDMGGGMSTTTTTITGSLNAIESLVDDGLLDDAAQLEGDVYMTIEFTDDGTTIFTINQEVER